jgi:hypothetical protein
MKIILLPADFECAYEDCPPGLFLCGQMIGLKSEYSEEGYCDTGERFCATEKKVIPLKYGIEP